MRADFYTDRQAYFLNFIFLFQPQLIQLCVCGVFRESRASGNVPVRAFNRGLIIVPQGGGFCIVNETLTITNATSAQSNVCVLSKQFY